MQRGEKSMKECYGSKVGVFLVLKRKTENGTEILLQRRCNTGYMDDKYDMACSGHLEADESLTAAVVREAEEELGVKIDEKDLRFSLLLHPYQEGYMNVFFSAEKYIGEPTLREPEKCNDLRWFNIRCLPENTIPKIRQVIKCMDAGITNDDGDFSRLKELEKQTER